MARKLTNRWLQGYIFTVHRPSPRWPPVPGVYVFAGLDTSDEWYPLYVGQTRDFATDLPAHDGWSAAARQGATHIHVAAVLDEEARDYLQNRLVRLYRPPLNSVGP